MMIMVIIIMITLWNMLTYVCMYVYISLVVEDKDMERQAMKDQIVVLSHSLEEAEGIYI